MEKRVEVRQRGLPREKGNLNWGDQKIVKEGLLYVTV